jgi:hypothetical protein
VAFWLSGWTGDQNGDFPGRKEDTLLVALTLEEPRMSMPEAFWQTSTIGSQGLKHYPRWSVVPLTPGARPAIVTEIGWAGASGVFELHLTEVGLLGGDAWKPGVHLFRVGLPNTVYPSPGLSVVGHGASTFATAVISDEVPRLDPEEQQSLREELLDTLSGTPSLVRGPSSGSVPMIYEPPG